MFRALRLFVSMASLVRLLLRTQATMLRRLSRRLQPCRLWRALCSPDGQGSPVAALQIARRGALSVAACAALFGPAPSSATTGTKSRRPPH